MGCTRTHDKDGLTVHHRNRYAEATPSNGIALCQPCHEETDTYGKERDARRKYYEFDEKTRMEVLENADNKCQCNGCAACQKDSKPKRSSFDDYLGSILK